MAGVVGHYKQTSPRLPLPIPALLKALLSATKIAEPCLWHPDCATAFGFTSPEQQGPTPGDVTWNGGP